jgi:protein-disulfide isomerase-like protein with CxxC motif
MHGRIRGSQGAAMTDQERKHLAQADRHIAECKGHIANQEEVIRQLAQRGQPTLWAEDMLDVLKGQPSRL